MNFTSGKSFYFGGICAAVLVLFMNLVIMERQEPWEDEVFGVSTGWSLARSEGGNLSVLADYPGTRSPIHFYGPVSFVAEAWLIRAFGLSLIAWRLACFAGVLVCVFVSSELVKLSGGDKWAQLMAAIMIALSSSVGITLPGRWDAVSCGLFLGGLLLLLRSLEAGERAYMLYCFFAGVLIGLALASTPRALTLSFGALAAALMTAVISARVRRTLLFRTFGVFLTALSVQTLLLLPWGQTSFSWYSFLRSATKTDGINVTPLTGQGSWNLDLHHHKVLAILLVTLFALAALSAVTEKQRDHPGNKPVRLFLTVFALANLAFMLLVLANALGSAIFWLPPVVIAVMSWIQWAAPQRGGVRTIAVALACLSLLLMSLEEAKQAAAVALTWNRRSTSALTSFVRRTLPAGGVAYGPIGGYFYPVELSGSQYLYPYEKTTPGLYSRSNVSTAEKLDQRICSYRSYAIWPKPDLRDHPEAQVMPDALRARLGEPIAEFDQPALAVWKRSLLERMGEVRDKYGFADVVIYSLKSEKCGKK